MKFEDAMRARLAHFDKFPATRDGIRAAYMWTGFCPCGPRIERAVRSQNLLRPGQTRPGPKSVNSNVNS